MAAFKARMLKKGLFEILGLEQYVERKLWELKRALVRSAPKAKKVKAKVKPAAKPPAADPLKKVLGLLDKHPRRQELIRAGKEKDQLLRSLVPLYLTRNLEMEVTSGLISRFWKKFGVSYAPPNAAKVLREHVGYARATKLGRQITPNGIKYVEAAVQRAA
ncbi:MAG: hypothetical protein HYZ28_25410 [Myxococcales bacterium]|nr:hypothetical protein [Myxococcales bacterium]